MLTTLVKRTERERAREDEIGAFEQARRTWPSGFADSREDALREWLTLSVAERAEAIEEIPRFVNTTKSVGRSHFCSLAGYLKDRRWQALPPRPAPSSQAMRSGSGPPRPKTKTWAQRKLEEVELAKALQPMPGSISDQVGGGRSISAPPWDPHR